MAAIAACLLLTIACWPNTGVQGDLAGSSSATTIITPSATIPSTIGSSSAVPSSTTPIQSSAASPSASPSPPFSPSLSPSFSLSSSPSPSPSPFLEYVLNDMLYIRIEEMVINIFTTPNHGYYNLTVDKYPALKLQSSRENASLSDKGTLLNFWKYYKYNKTQKSNATSFFFNFTFQLEPTSTDQTWYISSFAHSNRTTPSANDTNTLCKFEYSGLSQAVHAPSDMSYFCSNMTFKGECVDGIRSEVNFIGLWVQAFQLRNRKPSSTYIDCGEKDHNNSIINVVVGSVIGSTLAIALIIIIVTLTIKLINRKVRWRGYNLLRD